MANKKTTVHTTEEQKSLAPTKKVGRPTRYSPEFIKLLWDFMSEGKSYGIFGAHLFKIGKVDKPIGRSTLYEWEEQFPEWAEAKEIGWDLSQLWWEKLSTDYAINEFQGATLNTTNLIFQMRNRFKDFAQGMDDVSVNFNFASMSDDELFKILADYKSLKTAKDEEE